MSQEAVQTVRALFAALDERDDARTLACADPDIEVHPAVVGGPEGTVYRGHGGVLEFFRGVDAAWAEFRIAPEEFRDLGQQVQVLVLGRVIACGRETGVPLDVDAGWLARVREGRVDRFQSFSMRQAALEAVGLRE
jgi:ketosteroid isomerase-like protein